MCWRGRNRVLKTILILVSPLLAGVDVLSFLPLPLGFMGPDSAMLCWSAAAFLHRVFQSQGSTATAKPCHWLSLSTRGHLVCSFPLCSLVVSRFYGVQTVRRRLFVQCFCAGPVGIQPRATGSLLWHVWGCPGLAEACFGAVHSETTQ